MKQVLRVLLLLYCVPLVLVWAATIQSGFFEYDASAIYLASAMSTAYLRVLHELLGNLLVPLVLARSVSVTAANHESLPTETRRLFYQFASLFVAAALSYGTVLAHQQELIEIDRGAFDIFSTLGISYAKESLIYISILIGFETKGGTSAPTGDSGRETAHSVQTSE